MSVQFSIAATEPGGYGGRFLCPSARPKKKSANIFSGSPLGCLKWLR
jgi:hypothetical protein